MLGQPKGGIDEQRAGLSHCEFGIGRDLTDLQSELSVEQLLFQPDFVQPRRGQCLDGAHGDEIVDVVARQAGAVDEVEIGVEGRPLPTCQLLEVGIELDIQAPFDDRTAPYTARRVAEALADIGEAVLDAFGLQKGTQAIGVAIRAELVLYRGVEVGRRLGRGHRLRHRRLRIAAGAAR